MIRATAQAGNVYFGAALKTSPAEASFHVADSAGQALPHAWTITVDGSPDDVPSATGGLSTFPELASASRGLGFLNAAPDRDGVYRRVALVIRVGQRFYPSLALRVMCDYLSVHTCAHGRRIAGGSAPRDSGQGSRRADPRLRSHRRRRQPRPSVSCDTILSTGATAMNPSTTAV